jgi:hypothetical protein
MNPFSNIIINIKNQFPSVEVETRDADDPNGFRFLNVRCNDGFEVAIEWKHDRGFGLSSYDETSHELAGLFDSPDEWFPDEDTGDSNEN